MAAVTTEEQGDAFVIRFDDGKANALSPAAIAELSSAFEQAQEADGRVVVLRGREGMLSAGFDLKVMSSGPAAAAAMVQAGAELALQIYEFERPVVVACPGHAIAMGAFLLLIGDARIGVEGSFRVGLNEVAIGMTLPEFGVVFARERLSKRYYERATLQAEMFAPGSARDAGFMDRVVPVEDLDTAVEQEVTRLAALHPAAFAGTRKRVRSAAAEEIREGLARDVSRITAMLG